MEMRTKIRSGFGRRWTEGEGKDIQPEMTSRLLKTQGRASRQRSGLEASNTDERERGEGDKRGGRHRHCMPGTEQALFA